MTASLVSPSVLQLSFRDLHEYLRKNCTLAQAQDVMRALQAEDVPKYEAVLALLYDVGSHHVGSSCFAAEAPEEEHEKWFISVLVGSELHQPDMELPLCDSEQHGYSLAVERFGLTEKFFEAK